MNTDKLNHENDDLFRKGFENLSEEQPSEKEWQQMKSRLAGEGLLASKPKRGGYFGLLALLLIGSLTTIYFLNNGSSKVKDNNALAINSTIVNTEKTNEQQDAITKTVPSHSASVQNGKNETITAEKKVSENKTIASEKRTTPSTVQKKKDTALFSGSVNVAPVAKREKPAAATHRAKAITKEPDVYATTNGLDKNTFEADNKTNNENSALRALPPATTANESNASPGGISGMVAGNELASTQHPAETAATDGRTADQNENNGAVTNEASAEKPADSPKTDADNTAHADSGGYVKEKHTNRFHIGGYLSFDATHYELKKNSEVPSADADFVSQSDSIKGVNSLNQYTVGVIAGYMISKKTEVEAGVFYSKKKKVDDLVVTPPDKTDPMHETYSEYIYNYNAKYLELNGELKYHFPIGTGNSLYVGLGGVAGFNFPENSNDQSYFSRTLYRDSVAVQTDKITLESFSASFSALIAAGLDMELSDHWGCFIEPSYKYSFSPVIKSSDAGLIPVNHFPRTFSLGFGLKYGF